MLNFFLGKPEQYNNTGIKKYSEFDMVVSQYELEIKKLRNYYKTSSKFVYNKHLIARYISNLDMDIHLDIIDYVKVVHSNAEYLAKQFHITSDYSRGRVHANLFYKNSVDILLSISNNDINIFDIEESWYDIEAIKCIYHNDTDLDLQLPDGSKELAYEQLYVFEIDLTIIMVQYKYWALQRLNSGMSSNPNVFVGSFLLPSMLPSIFNIALFNRFISIASKVDIPTYRIEHKIPILDLHKTVDKVYSKVSKEISNTSITLPMLLETIPSMRSNLEVLSIDKVFYNSNTEWVLWTARVKYIKDIIVILGTKGKARNTDIINAIPNDIKLFIRDVDISDILYGITLYDTLNLISNLEEMK